MSSEPPLTGVRVVERAAGAAAAYAGRLLAAMGAETVMAEPPGGSALRREPPFFSAAPERSALFAYLAAGKKSVVCDLTREAGRSDLGRLLSAADIFIDDTPTAARAALGLDPDEIRGGHPDLVYVSVLPFGAVGPKSGWRGEELNLVHAGGEGFLLPNGLSADLFPDRPPLKIGGRFAEMQGGVAAALGALAALWSGEGQLVDASTQDANVAIGAFAIQRLGDGSLEHRSQRSFRYGGVIECSDGFVELLTLEERQWRGLVTLLGEPDWAAEEAFADPAKRSARGREINDRIRAWARGQKVAAVVARAQELGVPMAPYNTPADVLADPHLQARALFATVSIPGVGPAAMLSAPFRFDDEPAPIHEGPPERGEHQRLLREAWRSEAVQPASRDA